MIPPGRGSRPSLPDSEAPPPSAAAVHDGEARARAKDARQRSEEAYELAREARDLARELVETLGEPPAPGRAGRGLVGEFMRLDDAVGALRIELAQLTVAIKGLEETLARVGRPSSPPSRKRSAAAVAGIAALVTAIGGAGAAIASAIRGAPAAAVAPSGAAK